MNRLGYEAAMAAAEARRPKTLQSAHGAVIWYQTSAGEPGILIAAGHADSSGAIQNAMANCYHIGGLNYRVADTRYRGLAAVAEAEDGSLFYGFGGSKGEARGAVKN